MVCYSLDRIMSPVNSVNETNERLILADIKEADYVFDIADIDYSYELDPGSICFNKLEIQNDHLSGTLYIPDENNPANICDTIL